MAKKGDIVQSVDNAMNILDVILANNGAMSLKEIAVVAKQPKSTVHGYLNTLRHRGLVCQDENDNYMLGDHLFEFGMSVFNSWDFVQLTNPFLAKITQRTQKSSILSTVYNDYLMNVNFYPSPVSEVQIAPCIGAKIPFHATAQGKIILAGMEDKKIKRIIENNGLKKYTKNTITSEQKLFEEINEIRKTDVAFVNSEYKEGNHVISVPVKNSEGNVLWALASLCPVPDTDLLLRHRLLSLK